MYRLTGTLVEFADISCPHKIDYLYLEPDEVVDIGMVKEYVTDGYFVVGRTDNNSEGLATDVRLIYDVDDLCNYIDNALRMNIFVYHTKVLDAAVLLTISFMDNDYKKTGYALCWN